MSDHHPFEEAADRLRVGRTKAYAMTREWRETGGRSGLPVRDLGGLLRVPVDEFEDVFGVRLEPQPVAMPAEPEVVPAEPAPEVTRTKAQTPRGGKVRRPSGSSGQLGLFAAEG